MAGNVEERAPSEGEAIFTPSTLARALGKSRQAIDKAIRMGRVPGYRYPGSNRLWMRAAELPPGFRPTEVAGTRLQALEATVAALVVAVDRLETNAVPAGSEADRGSLAALRAENATLRAVNQLLLADAAERDEHEAAQSEAFGLLNQAIEKQQEVVHQIAASRARFRSALAQTQLPQDPTGI